MGKHKVLWRPSKESKFSWIIFYHYNTHWGEKKCYLIFKENQCTSMRNHVMNQEVDKTLYQRNATFFIKNAFFILASVLLNFSMNRAGNDAYVLLNACLSTITLTYCLHLLHLCSCLGLTLSMSYDLFFIFIFFSF